MKLIFHLQEGKVEEFSTAKNSVSIGRGNTCDIVLPYEGFSRRHAQIESVNGEIFVTDLGSTNGVYIDGERIPVSEKTAMQSFLNLQIGPAHQIEILDDEKATHSETTSSSPHSESTRSRIQRPIDAGDKTKTTRMDPHFLKKPVVKKEKGKAESSKLTMILFPLLIVGASLYYFLNRSEEAGPVTTASVQATGPLVPLTETSFLTASMIDSLEKNKSCSAQLVQWCREAGILETNSEGVVIEGKNLVVYMNMSSLARDKYSEKVEALNEKERFEILVLRRIFNSVLIRSLSRQTQFDNIQVIGGIEDQGHLKLKMGIKIKRDIDLKKTDKFFMYDLFDQILNQGAVARLSEISSLYEKLPLE